MEEKLEKIYEQIKMQNLILMLDKLGPNLQNYEYNAIRREIYDRIGLNDLMFGKPDDEEDVWQIK